MASRTAMGLILQSYRYQMYTSRWPFLCILCNLQCAYCICLSLGLCPYALCICVCQDILISKASETLKPAVSSSLHQNRLWLFPSGSQLLPTSGHITHRTSALQSHQCSGQKSLQLGAQLLPFGCYLALCVHTCCCFSQQVAALSDIK